jgi:chromosome segregation ATPase
LIGISNALRVDMIGEFMYNSKFWILIGLIFGMIPSVHSAWVDDPNKQICLDRANSNLRISQDNLNHWNGKATTLKAELNPLQIRLESAQSDLKSCQSEISELVPQSGAVARNLSAAKVQLDSSNQLVEKLMSAAPGIEAAMPGLILSLRRSISIADSLLNDEIAALNVQIQNERNSAQVALLTLKLERLVAIKFFKQEIGNSQESEQIFQEYIEGINERALEYILPAHQALLVSARTAFQNYLESVRSFNEGLELAVQKRNADKMVHELLSAQLKELKKRIEMLNNLSAIKRQVITYLPEKIAPIEAKLSEAAAKIAENSRHQAEARADLDGGCHQKYPGHNVPTPPEPRPRYRSVGDV